MVTDQDITESNNATTTEEETTKHANDGDDTESQMLKVDVNNPCNDVCFGTATQSPPLPATSKRVSPRISPRLALVAAAKAIAEDVEVAVYDESDQDVGEDAKLAQALSKSTRFNLRYLHYFL